jgi:hypothetical protein
MRSAGGQEEGVEEGGKWEGSDKGKKWGRKHCGKHMQGVLECHL